MRITTLLQAVAATALIGAAALPAPARAQADNQANAMGGISESESGTIRAKVKAIDLNTRMVTLVEPHGKTTTLHVGDAAQNLAQVKVGDTVLAAWQGTATFVNSGPNAVTPRDSLALAADRAPKGSMPAGVAASRIVITMRVVGVDQAAHTIDVVDPTGGLVHTVQVTSPEGQQAMARVVPGNTITAIVTDAVAISVERAH